MQWITLRDSPIAYCQHGSGPPLLLLHGWGGSSRYWRGTLAACADRYRMYALDLPGYGASPPRDDARSVRELAALVLACADALGLEQFAVNGHSLSTSVAVYLAAMAPQRVTHLVLTCASTYRSEAERRLVKSIHLLLGLWLALRRPWMLRVPLIYRTVGRRFFYRAPADAVLQACLGDFLRMDRSTALAHARDVANADYHDTLRQVRAPTLVIGARQDNIMPTAGTPHVARLIPTSQLAWIERCGHLPMIERPEMYHRLLCAFLPGSGPRSPAHHAQQNEMNRKTGFA
jgi:pimeloyl-ACP methyl ester carboxylesterase